MEIDQSGRFERLGIDTVQRPEVDSDKGTRHGVSLEKVDGILDVDSWNGPAVYCSAARITILSVESQKGIEILPVDVVDQIRRPTRSNNRFHTSFPQLRDGISGGRGNDMRPETYKGSVYVEKNSFDHIICRFYHHRGARIEMCDPRP